MQVQTNKNVKGVIWEAKIANIQQFRNEENLILGPDMKVTVGEPDWSKGTVRKIQPDPKASLEKMKKRIEARR